jgi:hypothetical protein
MNKKHSCCVIIACTLKARVLTKRAGFACLTLKTAGAAPTTTKKQLKKKQMLIVTGGLWSRHCYHGKSFHRRVHWFIGTDPINFKDVV